MRKMIWVKSAHSELWSCSRCAWAFNPSGPPHGTTLDEMMQKFRTPARQRVCVSRLRRVPAAGRGQRAWSAKTNPEFAGDLTIERQPGRA
jgi:hypothetical protein